MIRSRTVQPGFAATHVARALILAKGDPVGAVAYLESQPGSRPHADYLRLKTAVGPLATSDAPAFQAITQSIDDALRPLAILPRLPGTLALPPHVRLIGQTGTSAASWVGEGAPVPVSAAAFEDRTSLEPLPVSAIVVVTDELVRHSDPRASDVLSIDLFGAAAEAIDRAFIDAANAGAADKPGSITFGATSFTSSGSTVAAIDADLQKLLGRVTDGNSTLDSAGLDRRLSTGAVYGLSCIRSVSASIADRPISSAILAESSPPVLD